MCRLDNFAILFCLRMTRLVRKIWIIHNLIEIVDSDVEKLSRPVQSPDIHFIKDLDEWSTICDQT